MNQRLQRLSTSKPKERGSILVYCVICILFLSSLGLFFRASSVSTVNPTADTRRLYETQYFMDSVETVINAQILDLWFIEKLSKYQISNKINSIKTVILPDGSGKNAVVTRTSEVSINDIDITYYLLIFPDKITVRNMHFKVQLPDGSSVRRTRTLVFRASRWR